jgi:hypothetical protein
MVETMECNMDASDSLHWQVETAEERERRRIRNREYIRRRRADPRFRKKEKRRRSSEMETTFPRVARSSQGGGQEALRQKCWICRKRAAVEVITRLRPSTAVRSGFVQVRVAYCGFC